MKRLTIMTEKGAALKMGDTYPSEDAAKKDLMRRYRLAVDCLAAYEDTGLAPEEIMAAANRRHDCKIDCLLEAHNKLLDFVQQFGEMRKIREVMKGYDGRLVVLPCKNDTVYTIQEDYFNCDRCKHKNSAHYQENSGIDGKVYYTREEAEEALKKMEESDDETH